MELTGILTRVISGAVLAAVVVYVAKRTRTLSTSGALAAWVAGTLCVAAGWAWGALLLAMFVSASGLSGIGEKRKAERLRGVIDIRRERDAAQVIANGGLHAVAAAGFMIFPSPVWYAMGAGALAAAASDTWATELGTLFGGEPISITSGSRVAAGTSGGITAVGTAAAVGGALFIAAATLLANWPVPFAAVSLGGMAGALADSLLGGTIQERRWCELCACSTERRVHDCGTLTQHVGGVTRFENDAVNMLCSGVGAVVALLLS
ncbi:MAG: DUF92 domain-containing protein [Gemmatimonadaceae bacterium]